MNTTLLIVIGIIAGVGLFLWLGTKLMPKPFKSYPEESPELQTIPLTKGLPTPVERFYRQVYGEEIPIIHSFILTGRGSLRFKNVTLPARLRFVHDAGKGYRHYIETTMWGIPLMRVNEHYLDWKSRLALPFGVVEGEPQVDQAANLGMWSETMAFPGVYISTSGVRWEEVDEEEARLIVPFKDDEDEFNVHFNPETGLIDKMVTLRWKNPGEEKKTRWEAQAREWGKVRGWQMPVLFAAQWMDEETPWLIARIEDVAWNVDVSEYIQGKGI